MSQYEILLGHLPLLLLVIFRLGGLMIFGPVFGAQIIPMRVKLFFILVLGTAAFPVLDAHVFSQQEPLQLSLWGLAPLLAVELLIGQIIGFLANVPLIAVQTGGLVMGQQMGLGFARLYNPAMNASADIVGQLLFFMTMAGFLALGGHEAMVLAVLHSFEHVPVGRFVVDLDLLDLIAGLLLSAYELALRIAAPLLAIIFLQSVAMGIIARTMPQMNILSLGFPLRILVGLGVVTLSLPAINEVVIEEMHRVIELMFTWIESAGGGRG